MQLVVHPAAQREIEQALAWTRAEFGARVAARLRRRIDHVGRLLQHEPELGTPSAARARKLPLGSYPYTFVYREQGQFIQVLAFMHQSRLPDYWTARL